jgi:phosphoribosylamine--glycine ligase
MKILLVGGGGREHALAWKLRQSARVEALTWAPGNGGARPGVELASVGAEDVEGLAGLAAAMKADLVVVGPEVPLAEGLADRLLALGIPCFGPTRAAARLESSKVFCKEFCFRHGIPTAPYTVWTDPEAARAHIQAYGGPYPLVLKADGLAAGKGVLICQDRAEALEGANRILARREFGSAGARMIVEDFVPGEEASLMVFTDGRTAVAMPPARDHKRALDGDRGPNTGGMGAFCPTAHMSAGQIEEAMATVIRPALDAMAAEGSPYRGVLYAGLMLTPKGPSVLEFNCRFGDPETQVVLPLLEGDLAEICMACATGKLDAGAVRWKAGAAVTVVMASGGYPGDYAKGKDISGIEEAERGDGVVIFHAGTKRQGDDLVTAGGRVLDVTAVGADVRDARRKAYEAADSIRFEDAHYRRDIAAAE